jgi:hypothetical protein
MNYTQLKEFLSSAEFIYADVTEEELATVPCAIYLTEFDGIRYIGTNLELEDLVEKQILPTEEELAISEAIEEPVVEEPITNEELGELPPIA